MINRLLHHSAWSVARHANKVTLVATLFSWTSSAPKESLSPPKLLGNDAAATADNDNDDEDDDDDDDDDDEGLEEQATPSTEDSPGINKNTSGSGSEAKSSESIEHKQNKVKFGGIPIPFISRWAAKKTPQSETKNKDKEKDKDTTGESPVSSTIGSKGTYKASDSKTGKKKKQKNTETIVQPDVVSTTTTAHRADMAKLLGKWSR